MKRLVTTFLAFVLISCAHRPTQGVVEAPALPESAEDQVEYGPVPAQPSPLSEIGPQPVKKRISILVLNLDVQQAYGAVGALRAYGNTRSPDRIYCFGPSCLFAALYVNSRSLNEFNWKVQRIKNEKKFEEISDAIVHLLRPFPMSNRIELIQLSTQKSIVSENELRENQNLGQLQSPRLWHLDEDVHWVWVGKSPVGVPGVSLNFRVEDYSNPIQINQLIYESKTSVSRQVLP
jgi:hypothetical protein